MLPLRKLHRYGPCNTHDLLKAIAILLMVVDHLGYYFFPDLLGLRIFGRLAFPLFFFLIGYSGSLKTPPSLLFYAAGLTLMNLALFYPLFALNILVTVIAVRLFFRAYESRGWERVGLTQMYVALFIWLPVTSFFFEYGTAAIMIALSAKRMRHERESGGGISPGTRNFAIASLLAYLGVESWNLELGPEGILLMTVNLSLLGVLLWRYRLGPAPANFPSFLYKPAQFFSRYSLEFYFWHLAVFKLLSWALFPEQHTHFQWMP